MLCEMDTFWIPAAPLVCCTFLALQREDGKDNQYNGLLVQTFHSVLLLKYKCIVHTKIHRYRKKQHTGQRFLSNKNALNPTEILFLENTAKPLLTAGLDRSRRPHLCDSVLVVSFLQHMEP